MHPCFNTVASHYRLSVELRFGFFVRLGFFGVVVCFFCCFVLFVVVVLVLIFVF